MISDLVDGGDDGVDSVKELGEGLGNEGKFGSRMSNKLREVGSGLREEVNGGKEGEGGVGG